MWRLGITMLAANTLAAATGPCAGSGYDALAFFTGNWSVSDPSGKGMGRSKVELGLEGCEVTETWTSGGGFSGANVHAYSAEEKRWHLLNMDNHGHVHAFVGVASDLGLEYSGVSQDEAGHDVLHRMEIARYGAHQVKVWWRKSTDNGKTWTTATRQSTRPRTKEKQEITRCLVHTNSWRLPPFATATPPGNSIAILWACACSARISLP
jgi:hypothetical protein